MALARLIVCEATSQWVVALRRQLPRESWPRIFETRSLNDCWDQAMALPASMVVLEVTTANLEQLAAALPQYRAKLPRVSVAVLGSRRLAAVEWFMRELGAVHVVFSSRTMIPLVRIVQRHWSRVALDEPPEDAAPWRQLPWGNDRDPHRAGRRIAEPAWLAGDRR